MKHITSYITGDNLIRRILIKRHGLTYKEIIDKIAVEEPDIVSFDMFDTLIKRTLFRPNELFEILERDFRDKFAQTINTLNTTNIINTISLKELRINAEREAKQYANIYDIYDGITVFSAQEREWCIQHEIDLELAVCMSNPEMKEVYQWCKDRNIRIVITSDMYLPSTVLAQILQKAGYSGWENIFVSNECNADKSSGNLFIYVEEKLNKNKLNKNKILHIGDAFNADYVKARNVVTAYLYKCTLQNPKYSNNTLLKKSLNYRILNFFIKYSEYSGGEYGSYEKLGYECLGPLLYGYSKWLYSKMKDCNIKKVFFLAREGILLEKAFQIVCPDADISHCLIRVSRQSTCIPLLYSAKNLEEVLAILPKNRLGYTAREFLNFCEIPELEKAEKYISKINLEEYLSKSENKFWKITEKHIKAKSLEQKEYILSYLQKHDFRGNVAVADVGWGGTIQYNLSKIVNDVDITGFYFGTNDSLNITTEAYLFDSTQGDEIRSDIYTSPRIFEMFFLSLDGSTRGYDKSGALLAQPEQETEASVKIKKMQDSALAFVRKFSEFTQSAKSINLGFDKYDFSANYRKFVNPPSKETLKMFKGFYFTNTERKNHLVNEHTLIYYLFHLKEFKYEFINSGCKPWFVRSIFHLPLNYARILNRIRKL